MPKKLKSTSSKTKSNDDKQESLILVQCKFTCANMFPCEHRLPHFKKKSCGADCEIVVSVTM